MKQLRGTGVALITPFNNDYSIDFDGLENLIEYAIDGGVDFLVLLGTTAESVTLTEEEKVIIVSFCKRINKGRLPIVIGIGGNNTFAIVEQLRNTNFDGVDAILSVSPYYNKPTQEGIYLHYKMLAENCPVPIILYNVPGRTASNIDTDTILRLANEFNSIVGIKEASGNLEQIEKIIQDRPDGFLVFSGDDAITAKMILMGADGVIAVVGQSHPNQFCNMVQRALNRDEEALQIHKSLEPIYEPLYADGNPAGIKAVLHLLGICNNILRPPLVSVSNETYNKLKKLINK